MGISAPNLCQQIGPADDFVKRSRPKERKYFPHLLGDEAEQIDDFFRRPGKFLPQAFLLRTHPDRTGIGVTLAHHDATHGDQRGGPDTEFFRAQQSGDHHIAPSFEPAIGA